MDTRALSEGSPVNRFRSAAAAVLLAALAPRPLAGQTPSVDTSNASVLIDQGLTHSQVMPNLQYLSDVIGPRLTGSSAARAANDWTMARFKQYGLEAHLDQWNFGGTWTRGPMWMRLTAPRVHDVVAASWAWAPGTNGKTVSGPVVRIDASTPESLEAGKARVKGAWVMLRPPAFVWNNDGPPMTPADSERLRAAFRGLLGVGQRPDSAARARMTQFNTDQPFVLRNAGAVRILLDAGKEQDLLNMSGSPSRVSGEGPGLLGRRKYAEAHAPAADSIQAVIVLDNGAGAITGMALQGHLEAYALWRMLLAPVHRLNADTINDAVKGGTDHLSFIPYGVPGFNFNQLTRGYNHTHHSQSDTYDKAIAADLTHASTVIAVSAFELANLPEVLTRWEKRLPVQPIVAAPVSPDLLRGH